MVANTPERRRACEAWILTRCIVERDGMEGREWWLWHADEHGERQKYQYSKNSRIVQDPKYFTVKCFWKRGDVALLSSEGSHKRSASVH